MHSLRELEIALAVEDPAAFALVTDGAQNAFQNLKSLTLWGALQHLTQFIVSIHTPNLTSISLNLTTNAGYGADALLGPLASICCHIPQTVSGLHLTFGTAFRVPSGHSLAGLLEPALSLGSLECVGIFFHEYVPSIRDDDLARFGAAWPQLRHRQSSLVLYGIAGFSSIRLTQGVVVSPYYRNGNLARYLRTLGSLAGLNVIKILEEIAKGMSYLHHEGVIHGDLKVLSHAS